MLIPKKIYDFIPDLVVPKSFWGVNDNQQNCFYLSSYKLHEILFVSEYFTELLGYRPEKLQEGGVNLTWWLSIMHPDDREPTFNKIFQHYFLKPAKQRLKKTFTIQYRVKNILGDYRWICETKLVVSLTSENQYELILGRLEDITEIKEEEELKLKELYSDEANRMLKYAPSTVDPEQKSGSDPILLTNKNMQLERVVMPTKRELEILQLIGEGYSTKQIADKLFISINTVETHRRHLLEKLQVKNSMELIKRSANAPWLQMTV
jgi:PAS domain S-box-containing protein